MNRPLHATLTRCRNNQPLVVLGSEPFNGMEIRPHDLRRLAQQLAALADMADRLPTGGKHYRPTKVQINHDNVEVQPESSPAVAMSSPEK
jgi:hypothetical protein